MVVLLIRLTGRHVFFANDTQEIDSEFINTS